MSDHLHTVRTTCKFCRREFDSFRMSKVCPICDSSMEEYFQRIKQHLQEFPEATVADICTELDMPQALVKYYLKEERLEIIRKNGLTNFLTCTKCGVPITSGRFCFDCELAFTRSGMKHVMADDNDKEDSEISKTIGRFHLSNELRSRK